MIQPIDISQLPPPELIDTISFEEIRDQMVEAFRARYPDFTADLESEPVIKLIEVFAEYVVFLRQEINDKAQQNLIAFASGNNLTHLAAQFNLERRIITPATQTTTAVIETDASLRRRILTFLDLLTTSGSRQSYEGHALNAHSNIIDARATSPSPGQVNVYILELNDEENQEVLDAVSASLNEDDIRPLTDTVSVLHSIIEDYDITASLEIGTGPDEQTVLDNATNSVNEYASSQYRIGLPINRSIIISSLRVSGVININLTSPSADLPSDDSKVYRLNELTITSV